jgi:hypothetical protein
LSCCVLWELLKSCRGRWWHCASFDVVTCCVWAWSGADRCHMRTDAPSCVSAYDDASPQQTRSAACRTHTSPGSNESRFVRMRIFTCTTEGKTWHQYTIQTILFLQDNFQIFIVLSQSLPTILQVLSHLFIFNHIPTGNKLICTRKGN